MASFKNLIFFALAVCAVSASELESARVKKHAYLAAVPAPVLAYSVKAPSSSSYSYATAHYPSHSYPTYPAAAVSTYSAYPAAAVSTYSSYPAAAVSTYSAYPAPAPVYAAYPAYPAYPKYANDDGSYWPGKYEKTYVPAAYPTAYHY